LNFLLVPLFGFGSAIVTTTFQSDGTLLVIGPTVAVLLGWTASAAFGLNPLGDEGSVLPSTLTAVPGRAFVRGLVAPSLLFVPLVAVVTLVTAVGSGYGLVVAGGLTLAGCLVTVVGAILAPLIGMRLPRYSAIRIGNSDEVRPPRMLAGVLHLASVCVPGAALVGLVVAPSFVQSAVAGLGYVPGFVLGLVSDDGVLEEVAGSLMSVGDAIRGIEVLPFRVGFTVVLLLGGLIVARSAYRRAIRRFNTHELY
jgi:hypothetical protein